MTVEVNESRRDANESARDAMEVEIHAAPLCATTFAPYGDVIEAEGRDFRWINDGNCKRYDDLAGIDVAEAGGRPLFSLFEASPRPMPLSVRSLERHPLGSQAFFPLEIQPFLIVVAEDGDAPLADRLRAFWSSGRQGVNYRRNTWHHALIALERSSRFIVIDRGGPGANCEERDVADARVRVALK